MEVLRLTKPLSWIGVENVRLYPMKEGPTLKQSSLKSSACQGCSALPWLTKLRSKTNVFERVWPPRDPIIHVKVIKEDWSPQIAFSGFILLCNVIYVVFFVCFFFPFCKWRYFNKSLVGLVCKICDGGWSLFASTGFVHYQMWFCFIFFLLLFHFHRGNSVSSLVILNSYFICKNYQQLLRIPLYYCSWWSWKSVV